jgi:hypothetical protein
VAEDAHAHREQEALAEPGVEQVVGQRDRAAEQEQADAGGRAIGARGPSSPGTSASSTTSLKR